MVWADTWKTTPFVALLLLAGLQTIPADLYEAAALESANRWQACGGSRCPCSRLTS